MRTLKTPLYRAWRRTKPRDRPTDIAVWPLLHFPVAHFDRDGIALAVTADAESAITDS